MGHLAEVAWPAVLFAAIAALVLGLLAHRLGAAVVLRLTRSPPVAATIAARARRPAQVAVPLVALQAVGQAAPDGLRWALTFPGRYQVADAIALHAAWGESFVLNSGTERALPR